LAPMRMNGQPRDAEPIDKLMRLIIDPRGRVAARPVDKRHRVTQRSFKN
jgi:hypothetical protein